MDSFNPIDHKDSDAEHRLEVRNIVEDTVGEAMVAEVDSTKIVGRWLMIFPTMDVKRRNGGAIEFLADGTFHPLPCHAKTANPSQWRIERGEIMVQTMWCPPMPEYGIDEGFYAQEAFHCAALVSGSFVRWNGDGSMIQLFKPAPNEV